MSSNRKDWTNPYREAEDEARLSYPDEGYNGGYGRSESTPYHYGAERRFRDYARESDAGSYGSPYNIRGGESPGYSTANDFSGQEPVRGRLHSAPHSRAYRGYDEEDYGRYREMYRRSEYPETYRSAMSGYMGEHVGDDSGRKDYNQNPEGNLYGNRYRWHQGNMPDNYRRFGAHGYMRENDYDRGTPFYGRNMEYEGSYGSERQEGGRHKGKGPLNYRRADNRIQEDINERLTDDPRIDASEVDVTVQNGEVTLSGTVDDREAKRRAEDIAESVSGVTHVENRMRIRVAGNATPPPIVTPY